MAVPNSGQLRLRADINLEVNGNNTDSNVALRALADEAGFSTPDAMSDFYGYSSAVAPTVTTNNASTNDTNINARGTVNSDGNATITERGFRFGTNSNSATSNTKYTVSGTTGGFNRSFATPASTTRYYWAYATNSVGTVFGARVTATTGAPINYSSAFANVSMAGLTAFVGSPSNNPVTNIGKYGYSHAYFGYNSLVNSGTAATMSSGTEVKYRSGSNTNHRADKQNQSSTYFGGISSFTTVAQTNLYWNRTGARQYGNNFILSNSPSYRLQHGNTFVITKSYWRQGPGPQTIYSQMAEGFYISGS